MKLVEINMIRPEPSQRLVQFFLCSRCFAFRGFTGEEHLAAIGLEGGTELFLGIAVSRGHIIIVDAAIDHFRHHAVGFLL